MKEFIIQSSISDNQISFQRATDSGYLIAKISAANITAQRGLSHQDSYEWLTDFFEGLAQQNKPWNDIKSWKSWEEDFKISATCTSLGQVHFDVELSSDRDADEAWTAKLHIRNDFGALAQLAKAAKAVFEPGPNDPNF